MSSTYLPPTLGESVHEVFYPDVQTTVNLFAIHLRSVGQIGIIQRMSIPNMN